MGIQNTIPSLFEEQARKFPEYVAALHGKKALTYIELNNQANQLARYLQEKGVTADTPIALCLPRSFDFLIAIIAILKAGGAYLPLDANQPEERLLFLLQDSKAPVLISKSTFSDKFTQYQGDLVLLDKEDKHISQQATDNVSAPLSSEQLAYIIYTSGSTGLPKGVLIEHHSVINYCQWLAEYTGCQPQQRIDFSSSAIFDMAVSASLAPLLLGLTVVICQDDVKKNISHYLKYLVHAQIDIIKTTPSYFKTLQHETQNNYLELPYLKSIILGGENLTATECKAWLSLYPNHVLFNEYGPTETTVAISVYRVDAHSFSDFEFNVPIGTTGPKIHCIIVNEHGTPASDGETGELLISGICLARGYLNQPKLTQQKFITLPVENKRFYKTGDLCRKRSDGVLEYFGRQDDQVKIRGFRVEPGEIETCLKTHCMIKNVAVVAQKDEQHELRLIAYYILKDNEPHLSPSTNQIRQFLQNHVPEYMIPAAFVRVDILPLTANGKLDKAALPSPHIEASQHYVEPTTPMEKQLVQMWAEELGVKLIGLNDNFFELGGHSLSAARLVSKINHQLHKSITLKDFYKASSIAKLIPTIKNAKQSEIHTHHEEHYPGDRQIPLTEFQFVLWMADTFEPRAKKLNIVARKQFQGQLDREALEYALQAVLKKHEVLTYRVLKLSPKQQIQKNVALPLLVEDLSTLSKQDAEAKLLMSMEQLSSSHHWPQDYPSILIKLFHLKDGFSELQISMPHITSDDASITIIFADLSKYYLLYHTNPPSIDSIETDFTFKKYVYIDQQVITTSLDENISFWEQYLHDASFFSFPKQYVVENMSAVNHGYSTYEQIPIHTLSKLKRFCKKNHISLNNGLCAILALALRNYCNSAPTDAPYTVMNIVKSTRDNPIYDHSLGAFLRIEPIKIDLNEHASVSTLAKQICAATIETSNHQHCSNLIKLGATHTLRFKGKKIRAALIKLLMPVATKLLKISPSYHKILQHSIARLMFFKRNTHFIMNVNVRNDFIANIDHLDEKSELFGLKAHPIKNYQEDLLVIDYVFEACFFYDHEQYIHYLVVSANLTPEFRKQVTKEVVKIMDSLVVEQNAGQPNRTSYHTV